MATETLNETSATGNGREQTRGEMFFRPAVDIVERTDELVILADMPGVKPDQVDIHFEDATLRIHGHAEPRGEPDRKNLLDEYAVGDFYREFHVSEAIDSPRISAEMHDGVLVLHLPKVEAAKPRKIEVSAK